MNLSPRETRMGIGLSLSRNWHACIHTQSYLAWGTSMLEETTLRFCSSRDTDRASGSQLPRLLSTTLCSSTTSGLMEPPSTFGPSGAPLLGHCGWGMRRGISQCLSRKQVNTKIYNNGHIGMSHKHWCKVLKSAQIKPSVKSLAEHGTFLCQKKLVQLCTIIKKYWPFKWPAKIAQNNNYYYKCNISGRNYKKDIIL